MVNVRMKTCIAENCPVSANRKYDDYCTTCFAFFFPDDPRSKRIRKPTKELTVKAFLEEKDLGFTHDKSMRLKGCDCNHRRRVDFRKQIGGTLLCIEVDEWQHRGYDYADGIARYNDIAMIAGGRMVFIRYNPDGSGANLLQLEKEIRKQTARIEAGDNTGLLEVYYMFYK